MKFKDYQPNPSLRKMLTVAMTLALVSAPLSTSYARPDVPPGKVSTPVYDYRDFMGPSVTERVFRVNGGEVIRTQTLTRPTEGELRVDNVLSDDEGPFNRHVWYFRITDTDFLHYGAERRDPVSGEVYFTEDYDPPLSMLQSVMPKGATQGGATVVTSSEGDLYGGTRSNTALGLEDVEWGNDGTFSNCLSVFEEGNGLHRVSWYCPGVGLAKRIVGDGDNRQAWELDTYTTDQ